LADEQVAEASAEPVASPSGETDQNTDWRAALPDDLRDNQSLATIPDVGALAKSYVNAQSMIGADKIAIPGNWATDEDWAEVYNKLGRPESADQYDLKVNGLPEGEEADADLMKWYADTVHDVGLTPTQAQKLFDKYNEMSVGRMGVNEVDVQAQVQAAEKELRSEYGKAFDSRLEAANKMLDQFGANGITELQLADGTQLGDNPHVVKSLIEIANFIETNMGEDTLVGDKTNVVMTPEEAQTQLTEMMRQDGPYWDNRHPQHDHYVKEVARLMEYTVTENG